MGLSTTYAGSIQNGAGGSGATTSILKVGPGTFTLSGNNNTYTGSTTISNGVLALTNGVNGDGSIADSATINVTSGTFLDVSGRSDGTFPVNSGQVLTGRGTILGKVDSSFGGMIVPGGNLDGNTGILTATNSINLGGTTIMKLNRTNSLTSDRLVSSLSTITYGGTLVLTNIGPKLQPGDTFTLFSGQSLNATTFNSIMLPNYYSWDTSMLASNGTVSITAILPGPHFTAFDASQLASGTLVVSATNGAPGGPYSVLSTTNIALPAASWTTVTTGNFDGNGSLVHPDPGGSEYPAAILSCCRQTDHA